MADFDFSDLVGEELDFYGVDGQRFRLDDVTYEVVEHGDGSFEVVKSEKSIEGLPIARVTVEDITLHLYDLTDLHDGHCWLHFGDVNDNGWPGFVYDYFPRGPLD